MAFLAAVCAAGTSAAERARSCGVPARCVVEVSWTLRLAPPRITLPFVHISTTSTLGAKPLETGRVPPPYTGRMSEHDEAQRHVLEEAARVNEERMEAIQNLAEAVATRTGLEHDLNEAKKEERRAMAAAEKQGWTKAQVARFAKLPKATGRKTRENTETVTGGDTPPDSQQSYQS